MNEKKPLYRNVWRESDDEHNVDRKESKFGDLQQILEYLNRLTDEQEAYSTF